MSMLRGISRTFLCAVVSVAAVALAAPVHAADMKVWTKAPVLDRGEWRGFVEGGVFWTGGDPLPFRGGFDALFRSSSIVEINQDGSSGECEAISCFPKGSVPIAR